MGSNAHTVDATGRHQESKDRTESDARVIASESGRAKENSARQYRTWLGPAGGTISKLASFLIEGSVSLLSALASGAMAIMAPRKSSADPTLSKATSIQRGLNATQAGIPAETMAMNDGPGERRGLGSDEPVTIETPVQTTPLAVGPTGARSPNG